MVTIRFGSNLFMAGNDFTIVGVDDNNHIILGGFGPPPRTPIVWIRIFQDVAFLNADISDTEGDIVVQIRDNIITYNKDNVYSVKYCPENQIPPDRVVIINKYGETALDLRRDGAIWDFNCDFYHGGWHVVATPQGTTINPKVPHV